MQDTAQLTTIAVVTHTQTDTHTTRDMSKLLASMNTGSAFMSHF